MAGGYQHQPKGYDRLAAEIAQLKKDLDRVRTAASNRDASISNGDFTVKGGDIIVEDLTGNVIMRIGHNSTGLRGFSATSSGGADMLTFWGTDGGGLPLLALQDSTASVVTAGDFAGRGDGILWPYIPITFASMTIAQWPSNSTGSFVTVSQSGSNVFSQRLYVGCRTICDGGATAGQVRLLCNGVQVGSTVAVGTSAGEADFVGFVGDANGAYTYLEVQSRVTAGAGNCRVMPYEAKWMNHG